MPTNEERREVAEEMRQRMYEGYSFTGLNIAYQIGICGDDYDDPYLFNDDCWGRLAELIEPEPERTCENESSKPAIFTCSYCGADFYDAEISGDWNYCPNCGAEVVEE